MLSSPADLHGNHSLPFSEREQQNSPEDHPGFHLFAPLLTRPRLPWPVQAETWPLPVPAGRAHHRHLHLPGFLTAPAPPSSSAVSNSPSPSSTVPSSFCTFGSISCDACPGSRARGGQAGEQQGLSQDRPHRRHPTPAPRIFLLCTATGEGNPDLVMHMAKATPCRPFATSCPLRKERNCRTNSAMLQQLGYPPH